MAGEVSTGTAVVAGGVGGAVYGVVSFAITLLYIYTAYGLMKHCNPNDSNWVSWIGVILFAPLYIIYKVLTCVLDKWPLFQ